MNHKVKGFGKLFLAILVGAAVLFTALCGIGAFLLSILVVAAIEKIDIKD